MEQHSLLDGVDWRAIGYALALATAMSILTTWRARNAQRLLGKPLSPWTALIPDTLLGGLVGTMAAVIVPQFYKPLGGFVGTTLLSGGFAVLGPKITDWWGDKGIGVLLRYAGTMAGGVTTALVQKKDGQDDGKTDGKDDSAS
ncbi:hypothetical protein GCM10022631_08720 [Deinococcus rubellus]|uniref:Uncharacterized protein n=1 Tax=Deinococcus rubellus TaxID=1889240 RepID=A0ABY5YJA3_9DEIO|nr:hypothetical protein [Deinococcus rubellus]UWX64206.1 hypothetical protein N0D28_00570 [Deinococcus rubellus]